MKKGGIFLKTIIFVNPCRVEKYKKFCCIPDNMELIFLDLNCSDAEVLKLAGDADFIFADTIKEINSHLIENMPNLKLIHSEGVGYNKINIDAAKKANIYVCNNKGVNAGAVAEQSILLMLSLLRNVIEGDAKVRSALQIKAKEDMILRGITELSDCHVGLIGFGAIAKETAKLLEAFGARVSYYSRTRASKETENKYNVSYTDLKSLSRQCDIVSLHVPVTHETKEMVNLQFLESMKKTAFLINTSRGEMVNQQDLKEALIKDEIAGAGLDTLSPEPVTIENPLLLLPDYIKYKIIFSPHIGGTTEGAFRKMHQGVWDNINRVIRGEKPINIVNL